MARKAVIAMASSTNALTTEEGRNVVDVVSLGSRCWLAFRFSTSHDRFRLRFDMLLALPGEALGHALKQAGWSREITLRRSGLRPITVVTRCNGAWCRASLRTEAS